MNTSNRSEAFRNHEQSICAIIELKNTNICFVDLIVLINVISVGASGFKNFIISVSKPTLSKLSFSQFYGRAIKFMNTTLCADEIKGLVYIGL